AVEGRLRAEFRCVWRFSCASHVAAACIHDVQIVFRATSVGAEDDVFAVGRPRRIAVEALAERELSPLSPGRRHRVDVRGATVRGLVDDQIGGSTRTGTCKQCSGNRDEQRDECSSHRLHYRASPSAATNGNATVRNTVASPLISSSEQSAALLAESVYE